MPPHCSTKKADNFELPLQKTEYLLLNDTETKVAAALTKENGKSQFMSTG